MPGEIVICSGAQALVAAAAERLLAVCSDPQTPAPLIVLSGGQTPVGLYRHLVHRFSSSGLSEGAMFAKAREAFYRSRFFWGDERCVPPVSARSNYGTAYRELLEPLGLPREHYVPMHGGAEYPEVAAQEYERALKETFAVWNRGQPSAEHDRFSLVFLGLGSDGHTASLFPDSPALEETERWVVANTIPASGETRLTMTYPLLNHARRIVFLVRGEDKAEAVREILEPGGEPRESPLPAARIRPDEGEVVWLLDQAAAEYLV